MNKWLLIYMISPFFAVLLAFGLFACYETLEANKQAEEDRAFCENVKTFIAKVIEVENNQGGRK